MIEQNKYEQELKKVCKKIKKSFSIKPGIIGALATKKYLKKVVKLNAKTKNKNINELIYVLGRTKLEYKKYCNENNYYTDPYVNKKIKEAYIKLSRKAMKTETKKSFIKRKNEMAEIEYNSDRGSYIYKIIQADKILLSKEYTINNIKHLGAKRAEAAKRLKQLNFGINFFEELGVDDRKFYKVNPDIIHILLNEGKVNEAKMYIKEVLSGTKMNKSLKIRYVLNRDVKKGIFSVEENKNMKKMAKADRIANELTIFSERKVKEIKKQKESIFKKIAINVLKTPEPTPQYYFEKSYNIENRNIRNSLLVSSYNKPQKGRLINTNTGKIVAYDVR